MKLKEKYFERTTRESVVQPIPKRRLGCQLVLSDFLDGTIKQGDKIQYVYGFDRIRGDYKQPYIETFLEIRYCAFLDARDRPYDELVLFTDTTHHFCKDASLVPKGRGLWNCNYFIKVEDEAQAEKISQPLDTRRNGAIIGSVTTKIGNVTIETIVKEHNAN